MQNKRERVVQKLDRTYFPLQRDCHQDKNYTFSTGLTQHGGRFGKDENTPYDEFLNDDGISNQVEGGLSLKIEYEMMPRNQSCRVFASIS